MNPAPSPSAAPRLRHARRRGILLVEACLSMAILGVLACLALPSLADLMERRRLLGRADEVAWDLQRLRSQAVMRNVSLRITFGQDGGGTCYVVHTGGARDCTCASDGSARCMPTGLEPLRAVALPIGQGPQLAANVGSMLVDPRLGTVTPAGTLRLVDRAGREVRHVVNPTGRIRTCTWPRSYAWHPTC